MLESALTDVAQQLLHVWYLDHPGATEGVQRIVGEPSLAQVPAHRAGGIFGRKAGEAHCLRLDETDTGSECVLLTHRAGNDFLKIDHHRAEEVLGKVRAVEADRLVRVRSVIVIPVEKGRGSSRSKSQSVHS